MEHWQVNKRERPGGIKFKLKISGDFAVCQELEVSMLAALINFIFLV